jgi:hypothetical protein
MEAPRRVVIVGMGALGSHVALFARNWSGVSLNLVDFDRVEAKNIQSQFHTELGKGKNKALAVQQALSGMFKCRVNAIPHKLLESNLDILGGSLVIDCTDNYEARRLIQLHCGRCHVDQHTDPRKPLESIVPCLHGCLSGDGTVARAVWTEDFNADSGGDGAATCEDGQNLPFHAMAGALIAQVAQTFLEQGKKRSWQLTPSSLIRIA